MFEKTVCSLLRRSGHFHQPSSSRSVSPINQVKITRPCGDKLPSQTRDTEFKPLALNANTMTGSGKNLKNGSSLHHLDFLRPITARNFRLIANAWHGTCVRFLNQGRILSQERPRESKALHPDDGTQPRQPTCRTASFSREQAFFEV